jgi:uncharacterized membrane protein SpoIIM required for sporulation
MKESEFIRQNKEKWMEFEKLQSEGQKNPDRRASLFVEITNDLSYARTFYKHRSVRLYLNNIAQRVFRDIYKNRKINFRGLLDFWKTDLPTIMYRERRTLLLSAILFIVAFLIGVLSSIYDSNFARGILGDQYIAMTEANIANDDPMAVYKEMNQLDMTLAITLNNILVAFRTFILGVLAAVGTLGILIYNGIMVGVFQYFFIERDLFWESFLTIWQHGTIEISSIIIAGCAGMTMGKGLLYPETLTRLQSFQRSALRGLKIMVGIIPLFILAGFIEGFITRLTHLPDFVRLLVILASAAFILGYFVLYPRRFKDRASEEDALAELNPTETREVQYGIIRTALQMVGENIFLLRTKVRSVFRWMILSSIATAVLLQSGLLARWNEIYSYKSNYGVQFEYILWHVNDVIMVAILVLLTAVSMGIITWRLNNLRNTQFGSPTISRKEFLIRMSYKLALYIALFGVIRYFANSNVVWLTYLISPIFLLFAILSVYTNLNPAKTLSEGLNQILSHFGIFLSINIVFIILSVLIISLVNGPFIMFYYEIINWNFFYNPELSQFIIQTLTTSMALLSIQMIVGFAGSSMYLFVDTINEITYGTHLRKEVDELKKSAT